MDKNMRLRFISPVFLTVALLLCGSKAFASCEFDFKGGPKVVFNGSDGECGKVRFKSEVLTFYVSYPSMEVLSNRVIDDSVVVLRILKIPYGQIRGDVGIKDMSLVSTFDGVEIYVARERKIYKFNGVDEQRVYVEEGAQMNRGDRAISGLEVFYQFSKNHKSLREVDNFVLSFFKKKIIKE